MMLKWTVLTWAAWNGENPTVDVDRLAAPLEGPLSEFFKKPRSGASPPKPLRSGRKALR
jgi:hypothetical protein